MISFPMLGHHGRLGNQLFQYAFLRVTAQRLQTQFYCPPWDGDDIFKLEDRKERAENPAGITNYYNSEPQNGFTDEALLIKDNTEIMGFFQSEKYYPDKKLVKKWYTFQDDIIQEVTRKYRDIIKKDCVSLSLRIDSDYNACREWFPLYPVIYYKNALERIKPKDSIIVLSDRPDLARTFLQSMEEIELIFIDDLTPAHQLYLMTRCRTNIITNSSFAWWGAWLNTHPNRTVIAPVNWCRPGITTLDGILCEDWVKIQAIHPIWDHAYTWRMLHPVMTLKRIFKQKKIRVHSYEPVMNNSDA